MALRHRTMPGLRIRLYAKALERLCYDQITHPSALYNGYYCISNQHTVEPWLLSITIQGSIVVRMRSTEGYTAPRSIHESSLQPYQ